MNLILFSFLLANTQLFSASLYQLYKSSDIQSGTSSCPFGRLYHHFAKLPTLGEFSSLQPWGLGGLYSTILAEWLASVYPCPPQPPNPLGFMAQSAGLLSGIIVLARGENTWWWNCLSVKVFCSTLKVPGQNPQVLSTELRKRQERQRGNHQEWDGKTTTLMWERREKKLSLPVRSCETLNNHPVNLCLGFVMYKIMGVDFQMSLLAPKTACDV